MAEISNEDKTHVSIAVAGHVDSGKCEARDTPILMYDGSIKMVQDVMVGDYLMGDDSQPRKVLSTTIGRGEMFQVTQDGGDNYTVNANHVLSLKMSGDMDLYRTCRVIDIPMSQYLELPDEFKQRMRGYRCQVRFPVNKFEFDRLYFKVNVDQLMSISVESVGEQDYFGFELDGNHHYLHGDFTVTHNSTTTGRLIFELGGISEREMEKLQTEADTLGKGSFAFAFYMDRNKEERARGVTITTTCKEFFTKTKHFTILDAPGHSNYISNMITGTSQADVAMLMVPADGNFTTAIQKNSKESVEGQTRQHSLLLNLLGVKQLIICINKMDSDLGKYSEERYQEIKDEMYNMLLKTGWKKDFLNKQVAFLPISGYKGDNLITKSTNMPWWKGADLETPTGEKVHVETLLDVLDKFVQVPERRADAAARTPISGVYNIKGVGTVLTGRIEQGVVKPGEEVVFLPTHTASTPCQGKIFTIEMHHKSIEQANPGDNVGFNVKGLDKKNMPRTGDIMVLKKDTTIGPAKSFTAQVQILNHPGELKPGYTPISYVRTAKCPVRLSKINWKIGKETGGQKMKDPPHLKANEMAEVVFEPQSPFVVDSFKNCEGLARVAIMEGKSAVMLGKVISVERNE